MLLFLLNISTGVQAQKPAEIKKATMAVEDTYFPEFKKEDDMKPLIAKQKPFSVSYGGWLESAYVDDRSGVGSSTTETSSLLTIGKLWLQTYLPFNSSIYIRGKDIYNYYISKPEGSDLENKNDIDLDAGYFSIASEDNTINASLGRKFFLIGTGLVFNGRGDGGEFNLYTRYIDIMIFGAYTGLLSKTYNPYRFSSAEFDDKGKRIFSGGTLSKSIYNQTIYLLCLYQIDKSDNMDNTTYPNPKSKYNSQYYGLGLKGTIGDAFYYGEYIVERGSSYINSTTQTQKKDVNAMAAIVGINYFFNVKLNPVLLLNYAYGSGDSDRENTKSPIGNMNNEDKGFIYYGVFSGGYALRPYLSNIHIYQAGFTITPFDNFKSDMVRRINLIAKYSNYQKDRANAPINAGEASNTKKDIGHGVDFSLRWKIYSDFAVYMNFGLFIPGGAYSPEEKNRTFGMAGIFLSF